MVQPRFRRRRLTKLDGGVPPSSSPLEIYETLREDVRRKDDHSLRIDANRTGIKRGAEKQRFQGAITLDQERSIHRIVDKAGHLDFWPLMYVIPFSRVKSRLQETSQSEKASDFSLEYTIQALPRELFDAIELVPLA
jgi:hypothetical protein